ncbi:MAG: hypothetical protein AAFQ08_01765, partial [Bacteroidota bacterium]
MDQINAHLIGIRENFLADLSDALYHQGHIVAGNDDDLMSYYFDTKLDPPFRSFPTCAPSQEVNYVVVGRKTKLDDPALKYAQKTGLHIESYPKFIAHYAQDKQRIVIAGGEERYAIAKLVLKVLKHLDKPCDHIADIPNLRVKTVELSDAPVLLIISDMEPASPADPHPQALGYQHHILVISHRHPTEQPTAEEVTAHTAQMQTLADASPKAGTIIYCAEDPAGQAVGAKDRVDVKQISYKTPPHIKRTDHVRLETPYGEIRVMFTNALTIAAAQRVLHELAVT